MCFSSLRPSVSSVLNSFLYFESLPVAASHSHYGEV